MRYELTTVSENTLELTNPISVKINKDKDAPADSILIQFPLADINSYGNSIDDFKYIKVYNDEIQELVFDGIVDEQITEVSDDGLILEISGRSIAALLLDNEAVPTTYHMPSLKVIFERHVQPYGFIGYVGSDASFSSEFIVKKGMTEWDVLYKFCTEFLGIEPKITASRTIDVTERALDTPLTFSNEAQDIHYTYIGENLNRYNVISEVYVRTQKDGKYNMKFTNDTATANSIIRKRYIDSINDSTPASTAQEIIDKGNEEAYEIALSCPCELIGDIDTAAVVNDTSIGYVTGLKVKSIAYTLNSNVEQCYIVLNKGGI